MKALFLAGGMGTRLRPLTNNLPKPMVPIMNKPLLEQNFLRLKSYGVNEIILSTHYQHDKILEYFGNGSQLGLKIHYVLEKEPLGTGGAIKEAERFFDDTFIVFNSDILCDIDFNKLLAFHKNKKASVTIAAIEVEDPSAYGVIEYNEKDYIEAFKEKPKMDEIKSAYINAGVYIFEPSVLKEIPANQNVSIERETYPLLLKKKYSMAIYKSNDYWIDIGTIEKYVEAHQDILNNKCQLYSTENSNRYIGKNTTIHHTAKIIEPIHIGDYVNIAAFATIGPNAIIGAHSQIGENSAISNSILWDSMNIKSFSNIRNTILTSSLIHDNNVTYFD